MQTTVLHTEFEFEVEFEVDVSRFFAFGGSFDLPFFLRRRSLRWSTLILGQNGRLQSYQCYSNDIGRSEGCVHVTDRGTCLNQLVRLPP
jgi:hypothetical protein